MSGDTIAAKAAAWAVGKVGCMYSQAKRTQERIFDCSSLVARSYMAQGKRWLYGGSIPTSTNEVYDDDFELLWPENYDEIGKTFGGGNILQKAREPGDLQFLCTDSDTSRANRITHVAMVANSNQIVHARSVRYGVCTNELTLYKGKVCAICRYNPTGTLRRGMKGYRTLALQQELNKRGANLEEDGQYGNETADAVKSFQATNRLAETGKADRITLETLKLLGDEGRGLTIKKPAQKRVRITGGMVNIRTGPGKEYSIKRTAKCGETYEIVDESDWQAIRLDGEILWVSKVYSEILKTNENQEE